MLPRKPIIVCAAGLKGLAFVQNMLARGATIDCIVSYTQRDDLANSFEQLRDIASRAAISFEEARRPSPAADGLTFLIGWQYLLADVTSSTIVMHDSLLPRYRRFAPTATALIKGERQIGVTALLPTSAADEGPVLAQRAIPIAYPMKIRTAFELQARAMAEMAIDIINQRRSGPLRSTPQQHGDATFSIWRDDADFEIDWTASAASIQRFVDALGYPYAGARTSVDGSETIRLAEVSVLPDIPFEIRHSGKIWALDAGRPVVICGASMLRIDECYREDGSAYSFDRIRTRLGPAINAAAALSPGFR